MCPDLLGSATGVGALDKALHEGTSCRDDGMLGEDEGSCACARADGGVLGCTCGGMGLVGGDSCGVTIGEGTGDRGARGEASGEGLIDQLERWIGESGRD